MPLEEQELGNGLCCARTDQPCHEVQYQIVPRGRSAGHHELCPLPRCHEHLVETEADGRKVLPEGGRIGPVDRRVLSVQQVRFGQQQDARTGRAEQRSLTMHFRQPSHDLGMASRHPLAMLDQERGDDLDIGRGDLFKRPVHLQRQPAGRIHPPALRRNEFHREGGRDRHRVIETPEHLETVEHVVHPAQ